MKFISSYPRKFIKRAVTLYATHESTTDVKEYLQREIDDLIWPNVEQVPSAKTILQWVEKYPIDPSEMTDPVQIADMQILSISNTILRKAQKDVHGLRFRNMAEVVGAIRALGELRKELVKQYQNVAEPVKSSKAGKRIGKQLKMGRELQRKLGKDPVVRDNILQFIKKEAV